MNNDNQLDFIYVENTTYFNDSPSPRKKILSAPNSNLKEAYPYHQGTEISSFNQFAAGFAKITSGEPGHRLYTSIFGQYDESIDVITIQPFQDKSYFNPIDFVKGDVTYPLIIDSVSQNYSNNGYINPGIESLTIRDVISFRSLYFPFEAHSFWGTIGNGNESHVRSTDAVVSIDEIIRNNNIPYIDAVEVDVTGRPGRGIFIWEQSKVLPFVDSDNNEKIKNLIRNDKITKVINQLNYRDMGYISPGYTAYSSGYTYDGINNSVDSLAFGGMIYK